MPAHHLSECRRKTKYHERHWRREPASQHVRTLPLHHLAQQQSKAHLLFRVAPTQLAREPPQDRTRLAIPQTAAMAAQQAACLAQHHTTADHKHQCPTMGPLATADNLPNVQQHRWVSALTQPTNLLKARDRVRPPIPQRLIMRRILRILLCRTLDLRLPTASHETLLRRLACRFLILQESNLRARA